MSHGPEIGPGQADDLGYAGLDRGHAIPVMVVVMTTSTSLACTRANSASLPSGPRHIVVKAAVSSACT